MMMTIKITKMMMAMMMMMMMMMMMTMTMKRGSGIVLRRYSVARRACILIHHTDIRRQDDWLVGNQVCNRNKPTPHTTHTHTHHVDLPTHHRLTPLDASSLKRHQSARASSSSWPLFGSGSAALVPYSSKSIMMVCS